MLFPFVFAFSSETQKNPAEVAGLECVGDVIQLIIPALVDRFRAAPQPRCRRARFPLLCGKDLRQSACEGRHRDALGFRRMIEGRDQFTSQPRRIVFCLWHFFGRRPVCLNGRKGRRGRGTLIRGPPASSFLGATPLLLIMDKVCRISAGRHGVPPIHPPIGGGGTQPGNTVDLAGRLNPGFTTAPIPPPRRMIRPNSSTPFILMVTGLIWIPPIFTHSNKKYAWPCHHRGRRGIGAYRGFWEAGVSGTRC